MASDSRGGAQETMPAAPFAIAWGRNRFPSVRVPRIVQAGEEFTQIHKAFDVAADGEPLIRDYLTTLLENRT
ncbi:MAG: hypothetical protein DMG12_09520 [Acidobacteria bacterium]|nr:MAG: hypothetical protein DMG12_09520 [Acidobacteriota bacterium]